MGLLTVNGWFNIKLNKFGGVCANCNIVHESVLRLIVDEAIKTSYIPYLEKIINDMDDIGVAYVLSSAMKYKSYDVIYLIFKLTNHRFERWEIQK